jgi:hypothetical protein
VLPAATLTDAPTAAKLTGQPPAAKLPIHRPDQCADMERGGPQAPSFPKLIDRT